MDIQLLEHLGCSCYSTIFCGVWSTYGRSFNRRSNCICYRSHVVHFANIRNILRGQNTRTLVAMIGRMVSFNIITVFVTYYTAAGRYFLFIWKQFKSSVEKFHHVQQPHKVMLVLKTKTLVLHRYVALELEKIFIKTTQKI